MIGLGHRAPEGRHAVALHDDRVRRPDEIRHRADVLLHIEVGGDDVGRPGHHVGKLQRQHAQLLERAGREQRDRLVVMDVDDRVDVGPQPQDLPVQVVTDARRHRPVQQRRRGDVGDHHVVEGHLLERDLGVLGVGDAVGEIGMGHPEGEVAERVVDIAARHDHAGVAQQQVADVVVEPHRGHERPLDVKGPARRRARLIWRPGPAPSWRTWYRGSRPRARAGTWPVPARAGTRSARRSSGG